MDETERRKRVIASGQTDLERWADPKAFATGLQRSLPDGGGPVRAR